MNELETGSQIVNQMSRTGIELAEAVGDLGALRVFFGVFMVLMLLIMCTFIYQVIVSNKRLSKVEDAAEQTLKFFDPISNRTIGREESKAIIRESVTRSSTMMKYAILKIRYENNLSPGSADDRIRGAIRTEHNDRKALLGKFYIQSRKLSFVCEDSDDAAMIELMKEYVYMPKEKFTASLMAQEVNYLLDGVKARYQSKIDDIP